MRDPLHTSMTTLSEMQAIAERACKRARGRALHRSLDEFRPWVVSETALPVLHRSVKGSPQPAEELALQGKI
eukprot:2514580-Pyramimonas_sp.AAC.1